jgi:hypothetical protein
LITDVVYRRREPVWGVSIPAFSQSPPRGPHHESGRVPSLHSSQKTRRRDVGAVISPNQATSDSSVLRPPTCRFGIVHPHSPLSVAAGSRLTHRCDRYPVPESRTLLKFRLTRRSKDLPFDYGRATHLCPHGRSGKRPIVFTGKQVKCRSSAVATRQLFIASPPPFYSTLVDDTIPLKLLPKTDELLDLLLKYTFTCYQGCHRKQFKR